MLFVTGEISNDLPVPLDLTGKRVQFTWKVQGMAVAFTRDATVTDAANGIASYEWAVDGSDTAVAGNGQAEGRASDPQTGETWSWPLDAPATLSIVARVT
jgi:hypothetical protein